MDNNSVQQGYDRWAAVYDHDANPLQALEGPFVREACDTVREMNVLDLGCGTGRHTKWLAEAGALVTAVDFSDGMLAEAKRTVPSPTVTWVVHDLHRPLPFDTGRFDLVVSGLVLEHIREPDPLFAEVRRVLKPGGRAVLSTMHPAMFLKGTQARFTDPSTGDVIVPGSMPHPVGAFVMAAVRAGFGINDVIEKAPDEAFAERYERAAKYVGWPMLLLLNLK